jgi:hypothetical protein
VSNGSAYILQSDSAICLNLDDTHRGTHYGTIFPYESKPNQSSCSVCLFMVHRRSPDSIGADDGEDNYLTRTEVQTKALQSRALLGDGKAALVLAGDPRLSAKEKRYWQTISAEDGFGPGILNLGVVLGQDDSDPLNVIRARYWINIAITHHVHMADYELCMLDNKTNPAPPCILPITPFRLR